MTKAIIALQHQREYGIDARNGFLPSDEPLNRLSGEHELYWEQMLDRAIQMPLHFAGGFNTSQQQCQNARSWRRQIRETRALDFTKKELDDVRYIRRSRVVLSFLAHFYIHSQPNPSSQTDFKRERDSIDEILEKEEARGKYKTVIPASIAIPWITVSKILELPTILTYADTVLWNWHLIEPSRGIRADNLAITTTFSNTETERHFFKTSLLIELQGAQALDIIQNSVELAHHRDDNLHSLSLELHDLSKIITDMVKIFVDITNACIPLVFYWDVRTWFNGSDTSPETYDEQGHILQEAGKGWTFEGASFEEDKQKILTGPSAGQSSVIHALDIFLGVDHNPHHGKATRGPASTTSFMQRMQKFMPGPHSQFLTHLDLYLHSTLPASSNTSSLVNQQLPTPATSAQRRPHLIQLLSSTDPQDCLLSYNEAITKLCLLRDQHMRIVAIYILGPARQPPPHHHAPLGANIRVKEDGKGKGERGTGGTELVSFLKGTRNRTRQARLSTIKLQQ